MAVIVEKDGPVTTVILSRPEVRNAVDRETAAELADAFRAFEADEAARVAVFYGDHGHFCAGADLKKLANEFKHGLPSIEKEAVSGAARFSKGAGRHGDFSLFDSDISKTD
jgi:enoyl-CoA hydratase/carnithine racemase